MSWICPECQIDYGEHRGRGFCSCYIVRGYTVQLVWEDNMKNTIRWTGNTERFKGQTRGVLLSAELQIVKEIKQELRDHVGEDALPRGSAILCVFQGDKGIPFVELRNYGSASLSKLKKAVGQVFEIDAPARERQERLVLDYGTENNHSDIQEKPGVAQEVLREVGPGTAGTDRHVGTGVQETSPEGVLPEPARSVECTEEATCG